MECFELFCVVLNDADKPLNLVSGAGSMIALMFPSLFACWHSLL